MQRSKILSSLAVLAIAALAAIPQGPAAAVAAGAVMVPLGTQVGLRFNTPVDSGTIAMGTKVNFTVIADVASGGRVAIRRGAGASGTVTEVTKPGAFGASSKVVIGYLTTAAVDGSRIKLKALIVSKAMVSNSRAGAAGAAVAGAVVLGPVGLLAGALVRGGHVKVPAGTVVTDTTDATARIMTR